MDSKLRKIIDYSTLLGGAGAVIALDQWSKYLVRVNIPLGSSWMPWDWLAPYARIVHWNNTGAAFGLLPAGGTIFTIVAIIVSLAILYYYPRVPSHQPLLRIALVLQLGGAVGNLIDRLIEGPVTDFISVGRFPVFNLADSSIFIGVLILIFMMVLEERQRRADPEGLAEVPGDAGEASP